MKTIQQLGKYFNLFFILFLLFSCNKNDDSIHKEENSKEETTIEIELPNIIELAQKEEELSILVEVLESVDNSILENLTSITSKTVFAPTNDAFLALFSQLEGYSSLEDFNTEEDKLLLGKLVKHHIIFNEAILSRDLIDDMVIKTFLTEDITIRASITIFIEDASEFDAKILNSDNQASNGIVHVIDKILLSQTIINQFFPKKSLLEIVDENEELSLFKNAFVKAGLENQFNTTNSYTVFAPNNAAIQELFSLLGEKYNSFEDFNSPIEIEILKRILLYHVVEKSKYSENLIPGMLPTLLDGNSIEVISSGLSFQLGDASTINANLLSVDNEGRDGVIHIIDKILIPADVQEYLNPFNYVSSKTISELVNENDEFSFLKEALTITGLLDVLDQEGPFTVFVPTNESFNGLLPLLGGAISTLEDFDSDVEISLLRDILTYHILNEKIEFNQIMEGEITTLSKNNTIKIKRKGSGFELVDASTLGADIVLKDILAKNGVIHTIDRMLVPQSVMEDLSSEANKAIALVLSNIEKCDDACSLFISMGNSLSNVLQNEFTFFLPSNAAFNSFFNSLEGYNSLKDFTSTEDIELLKTILRYHCVESGKLLSTQLNFEMDLTTAQGEGIRVFTANDKTLLLDKTGETAEIISSNHEVLKGVIHMVDKVLLPQEVIN